MSPELKNYTLLSRSNFKISFMRLGVNYMKNHGPENLKIFTFDIITCYYNR